MDEQKELELMVKDGIVEKKEGKYRLTEFGRKYGPYGK